MPPLRLALLLLLSLARLGQAQVTSDSLRRPTLEVGEKGILVRGTDPFSYAAFRFRVQQLASATTESDDDLSIAATNFAVRRMRLRIESVLVDPRLKVNIQLSFSRGDQDFEASNFPNVLRDAYVTWQATPHLALFGARGSSPAIASG